MLSLRTLFTQFWAQPQADETPTSRFVATWSARIVWGVWLGMIVWVATFVYHHVYNIPMNDEWYYVRDFVASWEVKLAWLFERHGEHRFILGHAIYLGLIWVSGLDFRVGSYVTIGFLATASAVLILAARKFRGGRTTLADLIFPMLLLHLGHTENLMIGYQLVFTLTAVFLALFALLVSYADSLRPSTIAFSGGALMVAISLGGGQGLAFIPIMGCWVLWQTIRGFASGARVLPALATIMGLLVAYYTFWTVTEKVEYTYEGVHRNSLPIALHVAMQVFGMGVGPVGMEETPGLGIGVFLANSLCALVLLGIVLKVPRERAVAGGLLVLLGGVFAFALAVGYGRDNGWTSRFAVFSAMGPIAVALTIARYCRSVWLRWLWTIVVLVAGIVMVDLDAYHGYTNTMITDMTYAEIKKDVEAGTPINLLAQRHAQWYTHSDLSWQLLWENHFPLLASTPPPYNGPVITVPFSDDPEPDPNVFLKRKSFRVVSPTTEPIFAVRITFRVSAMSAFESIHFQWTDAATNEMKLTEGLPWVIPGRDEKLVFIIRGPIKDGRVLMSHGECPEYHRKECRAEMLHVEFIPMLNP
jgi:hypothetical protein